MRLVKLYGASQDNAIAGRAACEEANDSVENDKERERSAGLPIHWFDIEVSSDD